MEIALAEILLKYAEKGGQGVFIIAILIMFRSFMTLFKDSLDISKQNATTLSGILKEMAELSTNISRDRDEIRGNVTELKNSITSIRSAIDDTPNCRIAEKIAKSVSSFTQ